MGRIEKIIHDLNTSIVFENMAEGIVIHGTDGTIVAHNKAALEILGLSHGQLTGKDAMDPRWKATKEDGTSFKAEEHPSEIARTLRQVVNDVIMGVDDPTRGMRWLKISATPFEENEQTIAIVHFSDVTKEFEARNKLKDLNEYLSLALEGAGLGIWDWDLTNNAVRFDQRWAEMLGLSIDEIAMELTTWESRVHPDDLASCYADIKSYMDGKVDRYENVHRMKHQDGHWVYILDRGRFSAWDKEGKPIRFTGTHLDITKSQENERELTFVLEGNDVGIWKYKPQENILEWDKSMFQLYEVEDESFPGTYDAWVRCIHPDFKEQAHREFQDALSEHGSFDTTFAILTPLGKTKYIKARALIERDDTGRATMMVGFNTDVTKEHKAMLELNKQTKIAQHQAKLASIGELAAGVGHEINNPLTIVKGYLTALERKAQNNNPEELQAYISKINLATDRIVRIVQGLRTFSRSDTSEISDFSPAKAMEESFNMISEIYERDGVRVIMQNSVDEGVVVSGNRGKFQQVLMNLISNAKDATLGLESRVIELVATIENNVLTIKVRDNGHGVPDSLKEKIFDPFFTTKEVNSGTGIGLSLAYNFIKEMNGFIRVESSENEGATFIVELPVTYFKKEEKKVQGKQRGQYHTTVLVADDEQDIREILKVFLEDLGFTVTTAENGQEALELYLRNPDHYELIISDMKMPRMDGPTLLKTIRGNASLKQPKFVIITGGVNINFEDKESELNRQIDGYILKPFDGAKLLSVLERCLESKKS